jgi:hypothetical protein
MMHYNELAPVLSDRPVANADRLRLAVAAHLAEHGLVHEAFDREVT